MLVLWLGGQAVHYIWPFGLILGLSIGFFWLAFNIVFFEITEAVNRDFFNGWMGLLGSFTGIVGPWVSGWLISLWPGEHGYRVVFIISLCTYGISAVLSFLLQKRKSEGTYLWLEPWKELRRAGSPWRPAAAALLFQGLREGVFHF